MKLITDYLYPLKAGVLAGRYERLEQADHPLALTMVEGGVIVTPQLRGCNDTCVTDPRGSIVEGSVMEAEEEFTALVARLGQEDIADAPEEATVLYGGYFNTHWGHFLTDVLSRLWPLYVTPGGAGVDRIVFCLHEGEKPRLSGNIDRALTLLSVRDKIEFIDRPTRYRRVLVGETGVYPRSIFAKDVKVVYDRLAEAALSLPAPSTDYGKRLYMSRSRLPKAVKNEPGTERLDSLMEEWGYRVIHPEKMDLAELIHALHAAREVAAVSGTLPHNMLLGRDATSLTILEKYPAVNNYQPGVDRLRDLRVTPVDCGAFIRPVSVGLGPFIIYPTRKLMAWARDNKKTPPTPLSDRECRVYLRKFQKRFRRNYGEQWVMPDWLIDETALCCEAYRETALTFGPWLEGLRPVTLSDLLNPLRIARRLKRLLSKHR